MIILNHPVGGTHENAEAIHLDGKNRAISPEKNFIIMPNMFGNGLSLLHPTPQRPLQDRRSQV